MKHKMIKFIPLMLAALLFVGCSTTEKKVEDAAPVSETPDQTHEAMDHSMHGGEEASTSGAEPGSGWTGDPLDDPSKLTSIRVIHFDFDRSEIKPEYRDIVVAHGEYLAQNPSQTVTIEGHCDERGSREYNIGLGERRANAVRNMLLAQGAMPGQITTISYGEERPVALGSNEEAWRQNRRAVFVY